MRFGFRGALIGLTLVSCRGPGPGTGDAGDAGDTAETSDSGDGSDSGTDGGSDPLVCTGWLAEPDEEDPDGDDPRPACPDQPCPVFVDVAREAGIAHAQFVPTHAMDGNCLFPKPGKDSLEPHRDCEPGWFTAGVSVGDFDGDDWPDLHFTRFGAPDLLYRNRGNGTFEDVSEAAGISACTWSSSSLFADLDDDGDQDLVVTAMGQTGHWLFENLGDGTFAEHRGGLGLEGPVPHGGQSVTAGDYDLDGVLDLHVNEWIRKPLIPVEENAKGLYGPRLLRGLGALSFEDRTAAAGVVITDADPDGVFGFSSAFADMDDDGLPDLAMAVDFRGSRMFWNVGDGTFVDGTEGAGVNKEANAMGSTVADFDGDGRLDWFVSAIAEFNFECDEDEPEPCGWKSTGNRLYRNLGDRTFQNFTDVADVRDGAWGWGTVAADLDNDGDQDLALVNGWPGRDLNGGDYHDDTPTRLWMNEGDGTMVERSEALGFDDRGQGRGLAVLDHDRDGDLDLVIANHAGYPRLYQNEGGNGGHWLRVKLRGTVSNRDARGAKIRLQATENGPVQIREVGVGSQLFGQSELVVHFGVGEVETVHALSIEWPVSDTQTVLSDIESGQLLEIAE